jgi:hypothetical protein
MESSMSSRLMQPNGILIPPERHRRLPNWIKYGVSQNQEHQQHIVPDEKNDRTI